VQELVTSVLQVHKDDMQARSQSSTAPLFQRGGKYPVITKGLLLCGQLNRKLRDKHLGPFTVFEKIGANSCRLELPYTIRLHPCLVHITTSCIPCTPRKCTSVVVQSM
jgi:hypothetical protein